MLARATEARETVLEIVSTANETIPPPSDLHEMTLLAQGIIAHFILAFPGTVNGSPPELWEHLGNTAVSIVRGAYYLGKDRGVQQAGCENSSIKG